MPKASVKRIRALLIFELFVVWQLALVPIFSLLGEFGRSAGYPLLVLIACYELCLFIVLYKMFRPGISISLFMLGIYMSVFLIYPAMTHVVSNRFPFYGIKYQADTILQSGFIVFIFLLGALTAYWLARRSEKRIAPARSNFRPTRPRFRPALSIPLATIAVIASAVAIGELGIANFVTTRSELYENLARAQSADLGLYQTLPRLLTFMTLFALVSALRFGDATITNIALLILIAPFFLIVNFPGALPRLYLFGYLIAFLLLFLDLRKVWVKLSLLNGFALGAFLIMPMVDDITRRGLKISDFSISRALMNYTTGGDFDGFQSINNVVEFVSVHGIQWGRQLLSAIFFFVPRSVWPNKGEPTGSIAAQEAGYSFLNISSPLPSEFYIDFGIFGLVIGALLFGALLARIDMRLEFDWDAKPTVRSLAGLIAGFSVIFYRGPLLGIVPVIGVIAALAIFVFIFGFRYRRSVRSIPTNRSKLIGVDDALTTQA